MTDDVMIIATEAAQSATTQTPKPAATASTPAKPDNRRLWEGPRCIDCSSFMAGCNGSPDGHTCGSYR